MQIMILNSGLGSRLGKYTENTNKCFVDLGQGKNLFDYQMDTIKKLDFSEIVITTGYLAKNLEYIVKDKYPADRFRFVFNPKYTETNYIYSIFLAIPFLSEDLLLLHGDLYFEKELLLEMVNQNTSVVAADYNAPYSPKDFQAIIKNGKIEKIATKIPKNESTPVQPLYFLKAEDRKIWFDEIESFVKKNNTSVYAEDALNEVLCKINLKPFDVKGRACFEIDDEEDLKKAKILLRG